MITVFLERSFPSYLYCHFWTPSTYKDNTKNIFSSINILMRYNFHYKFHLDEIALMGNFIVLVAKNR